MLITAYVSSYAYSPHSITFRFTIKSADFKLFPNPSQSILYNINSEYALNVMNACIHLNTLLCLAGRVFIREDVFNGHLSTASISFNESRESKIDFNY